MNRGMIIHHIGFSAFLLFCLLNLKASPRQSQKHSPTTHQQINHNARAQLSQRQHKLNKLREIGD